MGIIMSLAGSNLLILEKLRGVEGKGLGLSGSGCRWQASNEELVASRREDQAAGHNAQVGRARDGLVADHDEGQPEHIHRDMLRVSGRQAILDLLVRIERERQRELEGLLEHRAVSDFAHRNRIQVCSLM
ncbi:E3 UBIQUITIN-PROTEIN LIGASE XBOS34-RELATED [Salix koriyanagi]|uniref:E3 UBIQUITIN-PROTEIN LIGASE XBOS34-RELATED n=1 Tax=Salix koriyanagi TaxID=2511006 RepID=A0A9Q0WUE9_9ROSI|nr:E3 UBIQUITIN-PROTEIN LIGASE XBOS34-RELATED [Salix koriyanagi]